MIVFGQNGLLDSSDVDHGSLVCGRWHLTDDAIIEGLRISRLDKVQTTSNRVGWHIEEDLTEDHVDVS